MSSTTRLSKGVAVVAVYLCATATVSITLSDWGTQDHILTPAQRILIRGFDRTFGVSDMDIKARIELEKSKAAVENNE